MARLRYTLYLGNIWLTSTNDEDRLRNLTSNELQRMFVEMGVNVPMLNEQVMLYIYEDGFKKFERPYNKVRKHLGVWRHT